MPRVVIVGAGLSGLSVAFRLRQQLPGVELTVLEGRSRPGGNVWTDDRDGFRVEHGPNGFLDTKPSTVQLCRDLGLGDRLLPASEAARKNRFLFVGGRLRKLPSSLPGLVTTRLLSAGAKLNLLRERFRKRPAGVPADETVAAFARRRLGREIADTVWDALVTGIYAGDPERLSLRAAFPRVARFEDEHGSIIRGMFRSLRQRRREAEARGERPAPQRMWSFREGLRVLIDALAGQPGLTVTTGVTVKRVEPTSRGVQPPGPRWLVRGEGRDRWEADAVVLACPAYEQAAAVADLDPALAADLAAVEYNRIAVVALGYRRSDVPGSLDGFGYIAPQNTRRDVLGVQWCSSTFPGRAPPGYVLLRALCGGVNRPDVFELDDDALVRTCHREMQVALGVRGTPAFREVIRWPRAIPQYTVGHLDRVARVESAAAKLPGLFLAGNALHGVAMGDVTEQAELVAGRVAEFLTRRQGDKETR